jgi:hypothetical protein
VAAELTCTDHIEVVAAAGGRYRQGIGRADLAAEEDKQRIDLAEVVGIEAHYLEVLL